MNRLALFAGCSLALVLLAGPARAATLAPTFLGLTTATEGGGYTGPGDQQLLYGTNAGSLTTDHTWQITYSNGDRVSGQAIARAQGGGESSLGAPPYAEAVAHASAATFDPNYPYASITTASADAGFSYSVQISPLQPIPGGLVVMVPYTIAYNGQATLTGTPLGNSVATANFSIGSFQVQARARLSPTVQTFDAFTGVSRGSMPSDNLLPFTVAVHAAVTVTAIGNYTAEAEAIADPTFAFDQAQFDADMLALGLPSFTLTDYFAFEYSEGYFPVPEPEVAALALAALGFAALYSQRRTAAV